MFGRFSIAAAAAAAVLTASPAFAATTQANPAGGQGALWTQEAPTGFFGTQMGAVLPRGVQYFRASGAGINFGYGWGFGGEFGWNLNGIFNNAANLGPGIGLGVGYKQQFIRTANSAIAWRLGAMANSLGASAAAAPAGAAAAAAAAGVALPAAAAPGPTFGAMVGLPMTFDMGASLLSIDPGFTMPNVTAGTTGAMVGAGIGLQAPMAPFWSFLGEVYPNVTLGTNAFTAPITLGARLSPTALSHVDFTLGSVNVTPGFGLTVGTIGVTGHVGFR